MDIDETLANLAKITDFFTVNPEFQERVDGIRKNVARLEELTGALNSKAKADGYLRDAENQLSAAQNQKKEADNIRKEAERLRTEADREIDARVDEKLAPKSEELNKVLAEARDEAARAKQAKASYEGKAKDLETRMAFLNKKEADLQELSQTLDGNRDKLTADQRAFDERRERLAAAAASV